MNKWVKELQYAPSPLKFDNFASDIFSWEKGLNERELSLWEYIYNPKGFCFGWKSFVKLIYLFRLFFIISATESGIPDTKRESFPSI